MDTFRQASGTVLIETFTIQKVYFLKNNQADKPATTLLVLACAVAAGQADRVIVLTESSSPPKQLRRLRKQLNASDRLSLEHGVVRNASGNTAPAIAS